jgi:16S rRNA (guanine527-N7)-methyltransferase
VSVLYEHARAFGIDLTDEQLERFAAYYRLLAEWNQRFNLTSITEYTDVEIKHFLDSLSVARALPPPLDGKKLIDVGAGAGFPGAPLAIAFPYLRVTLLEATGKKVQFLDTLTRELPLDNATALKGRAEEVAHQPAHRAQYDFATARALAPLRTLVEYALPFVRVGGRLIAPKGIDAQAETDAAAHAIRTLGGRVGDIMPIRLPTLNETRHLVVIDKIASTPAAYPRRAGMPLKQPL